MRFMVTFTHVEGAREKLGPSQLEDIQKQHGEFVRALREEQNTEMTFFGPPESAKTVRRHEDGRLDVTDGPYTPGPEFVGGYFIIEAESMDEAVSFASRGRYMTGANQIHPLVG